MDIKDNANNKSAKPVRSDVDRSWAWVVLCATTFNTLITTGQVLSVSIYYVVFLQEFKASRSFTAWIPAALSTMICSAGPLTSLLLPCLGARKIMFLGSLLMSTCFILIHFSNSIPYLIVIFAIMGISQSFTVGGNLLAISTYFKQKAPLATSITLAGAGLGSMVVGLEVEWAMATFGWRGAMFIQAGVVLHMCVSGSLIYSMKTNEVNCHASADTNGKVVTKPDSESSKMPIKDLFGDSLFWLSVGTFLAINANLVTINAILKGVVLSYGLESTFTTVITTFGIGNMVGRVSAGTISKFIHPPLHLFATGVISALATIGLIYSRVPWAISTVAFLFAFCQGQLVVIWILKIAWVFGQKKMPIVRGYVMFFSLITSMSCAPIAGYTMDLTGSYNTALIMVAAFSLLAGICGLVILWVHKRRSKNSETSELHPTSHAIDLVANNSIITDEVTYM